MALNIERAKTAAVYGQAFAMDSNAVLFCRATAVNLYNAIKPSILAVKLKQTVTNPPIADMSVPIAKPTAA